MIVNIIFGFVTDIKGESNQNPDIDICRACLFEPLSGKCVGSSDNSDQ